MLFVNGDALCDDLVKVDVTMMTRQAMTLHVIRLSRTTLRAIYFYFYINDNVLLCVFGSARHTFSGNKCAQMSLNEKKRKKERKKKGNCNQEMVFLC